MIIKPTGAIGSKIAIVGDVPGRDAAMIGRPFSGAKGKILNRMLEEVGIERSECYITYLFKLRPDKWPKSFYENKSCTQPKQELKDAWEALKKELSEVSPNVIIPLGEQALRAVTTKKGINNQRGSILLMQYDKLNPVEDRNWDRFTFKVVPTFDSEFIRKHWEKRPLAIFDLRRAKEQSKTNIYDFKERDWEKIESLELIKAKVKQFLKDGKYLSFDIETANKQITCISFAINVNYAFTIPIRIQDHFYWTQEEEVVVWSEIKKLLESDLLKITQNGNYDMFYTRMGYGIKPTNTWMDTMNAHHVLYPELQKSLAVLCSLYTEHPYYKDMVGTEYFHYNCLDSIITLECALSIEKELEEFKLQDFYHKHVQPVEPILLDMQCNGVKINQEKRERYAKQYAKEADDLEKKLQFAVGYELNVASSKQMCNFLYNEMELPQQFKKDKDGNEVVTADVDALKALRKLTDNKLFDTIIEIRQKRKIVSTYLRAKIDDDGRFRSSYLISGAETGRLSSRKCSWGTGGNLQNVPKGICREVFVPDDGYMFVSADLSQADARVVAYLANESRLIEVFETGGDIHTKVAAMLFKKPEADITKGERALGKTIVHASNYSMGPKAFSKHTGLSYRDSKDRLNSYHTTFPNIRVWHLAINSRISRTRTLTTPLGRTRAFFGRLNDNLLRDAYAFIPQSTVSDVILIGMKKLYDALPVGCRIVFNIHDEIVIQIPKYYRIEKQTWFKSESTVKLDENLKVVKCTKLQWIKDLMKECMSVPLTIGTKTFTIPIGVTTGHDWNEVSG